MTRMLARGEGVLVAAGHRIGDMTSGTEARDTSTSSTMVPSLTINHTQTTHHHHPHLGGAVVAGEVTGGDSRDMVRTVITATVVGTVGASTTGETEDTKGIY